MTFIVNHSFCDWYQYEDTYQLYIPSENYDRWGGKDNLQSLTEMVVYDEDGENNYLVESCCDKEHALHFQLRKMGYCIQ